MTPRAYTSTAGAPLRRRRASSASLRRFVELAGEEVGHRCVDEGQTPFVERADRAATQVDERRSGLDEATIEERQAARSRSPAGTQAVIPISEELAAGGPQCRRQCRPACK